MAEVELTLSKTYTPPSPKTATKLIVEGVALRITGRLMSSDGDVVSQSFTAEYDVTDDSTIRAQAIALGQASNPERYGQP